MPKTTHDLGLKTSIQTFDTFVRCTLMGNQPWPQFQNGIRERSIMINGLAFGIKEKINTELLFSFVEGMVFRAVLFS